MINKNQYERSIITINKNVPVFVRSAYNKFAECLGELQAEYIKAAQEHPHSVQQCIENLLYSKKFTATYASSFPDNVVNEKFRNIISALENELYNHNDPAESERSADEAFYTINGPDIYAPVKSITAKFTPFIKLGNSEYNNKIAVCFEPMSDSRSIETMTGKHRTNHDQVFNSWGFEGMNGFETILDNLKSRLVVDIKGLFDNFFAEVSKHIQPTCPIDQPIEPGDAKVGDGTLNLKELADVYKTATGDKAAEVIEYISNLLTKEAIVTYFVYASKLIGAKNDIFQWMYTSFVKDSVSKFDQTLYPTKAPVTLASELGTHGTIDAQRYRDDDGNPMMNDVAEDEPKQMHKILIYRSIRMQYSVWAAIINGVLAVNKDIYYDGLYEESKERNTVWSTKYNTQQNGVYQFTREALMAFVIARYRTYNTTQQIDMITNTPYQSVKNIQLVINKVKDLEAATIVKSVTAGTTTVSTIYFETSPEIYSLLALSAESSKQMRKLVLQGCYLVMLSKMYQNIGKAKDEIEPATGRSRKDLFIEIYMGIANQIRKQIRYFDNFTYDYWKFEDLDNDIYNLIKEIGIYYTPFTSIRYVEMMENAEVVGACKTIRRSIGNSSDESPFVSESLNKIYTWLKNFKGDRKINRRIVNETTVDMPIFSEYTRLSDWGNDDTMAIVPGVEYPSSSTVSPVGKEFNQGVGNQLFPKNKIILEGIERMNINEHRMFTSVEAVQHAIDELHVMKDLAFEGADAMASNACYSQLGSVCSGVTSMEITNEETAAKDKLTVAQHGNDVIDSGLTDAEGNIMAKGTTDTLDQANLTHHSVESAHEQIEADLKNSIFNKTTESFNLVFNDVVLGLK